MQTHSNFTQGSIVCFFFLKRCFFICTSFELFSKKVCNVVCFQIYSRLCNDNQTEVETKVVG